VVGGSNPSGCATLLPLLRLMKSIANFVALLFITTLLFSEPGNTAAAKSPIVPSDFQDIKNLDPTVEVEMRYASSWNFIGKPVTGYKSNKCYLTKQAGKALSRAQSILRQNKFGLLLFDCYRPKRAVNEFVSWTKSSKNQTMKPIFYPEEGKESLIDNGYIADKSGHSRGSTVDLTIIKVTGSNKNISGWPNLLFQENKIDCRKPSFKVPNTQLNMGTTFDCFSKLANTNSIEISLDAQKNRKLLLNAMTMAGFLNYEKEWWHFTLLDEPYKKTYFDFPIN
jgi:zinc D-Ala-D-Ala dipeptidase